LDANFTIPFANLDPSAATPATGTSPKAVSPRLRAALPASPQSIPSFKSPKKLATVLPTPATPPTISPYPGIKDPARPIPSRAIAVMSAQSCQVQPLGPRFHMSSWVMLFVGSETSSIVYVGGVYSKD
jgi:hypothetical protein